MRCSPSNLFLIFFKAAADTPTFVRSPYISVR